MFNLELVHDQNCQRLNIGFAKDVVATNAELVPFVEQQLEELINREPMQGRLLKINGACSVPIALTIAHKVAHLYGAVAMFDPKLSGYVVAITHNPEYKLGMVLSDEPIIV